MYFLENCSSFSLESCVFRFLGALVMAGDGIDGLDDDLSDLSYMV